MQVEVIRCLLLALTGCGRTSADWGRQSINERFVRLPGFLQAVIVFPVETKERNLASVMHFEPMRMKAEFAENLHRHEVFGFCHGNHPFTSQIFKRISKALRSRFSSKAFAPKWLIQQVDQFRLA